MEYFSIIVPKLANLLLLLLTGVIAFRVKAITPDSLKVLSGLLMKIILPVLSFNLLLEQRVTLFDLVSLKTMVLGQLAIYPLAILAGFLTVRLMKMEYPQKNVHLGCTVCGNYAYVVLPLLYSLYQGTRATIYIPLGCSLEALAIWTVGLALYTQGQGRNGLAGLKNMLNPTTFAVLLGFLVNTIRLPIPQLVADTIDQIGSVSTPLGMIYLGASLCIMEWRNVSNLEHALAYVAAKMFLVPLLVYVIVSHFLPETESIVLMLTAASPSATIAVMISREFGLDADYAGEIVSISTISCVVTIPLLFLCVGFL
ncbi:MAG: AEC family transporter [Clostridiales bacterium]|nr:AEC family transporter [Clostridiales bacterium]